MLIIKSIKLVNFLSHSKTELEFKPNQKLIISGKSGSGKSSIIDSMVWCFFGQGRSDNRSLIKRGTKNASVIVKIYDEEEKREYCIKRYIDSKNKHELNVTENNIPIKVNGIRETQEYIEKEILHSSYSLFINSIVYLQENTESFVSQTAIKKKDIILEIIGASAYDEHLKKAKIELQKIKTNKEVLLSKIDGAQNFITNNEEVANKLKEYEKEDVKLIKEIDTLKEEYKKYTDRQQKIESEKFDVRLAQQIIKNKLEEYDAWSLNLKNLNEKIIDLSNVDIDTIKKDIESLKLKQVELENYNKSKDDIIIWNEKYTEILSEKPIEKDYKSLINEINNNLIDIINEQPEECPKCGYIDPKWGVNHQERLKHQEDLLKLTQGKLTAYDELVKEYNQKEKELGEQPTPSLNPVEYDELKIDIEILKEAEKDLIKAETAEKEMKDAETEIKLINTKQEKLSKEIEKMTVEVDEEDFYEEESVLKNNIIKINGKIDELLMKHSSNKELSGIAKHSKKKVEESKTELKKHKKDILSNDESLESLELVKGAFGPNGIKAIVIDYLLPELETRINNILSQLSGFRIELSTQKSGAGKDIVLEGLYINVINSNNEIMDYGQYSGGEKVKISIAIFEALASLSKCNFRVLDEAIVALDDESVQNFLFAMEEVLKNVNQVICISHINEIKSIFEEKIEVQKINGNSSLK